MAKMYDSESASEDAGMEECDERAKHITAAMADVKSGSALRDEMPDGIDYQAFQARNVTRKE